MNKTAKILTLAAATLSLVACGGKTTEDSSINQGFEIISAEQQQTTFEEEYISKNFSYAEGGKFAMSMISGIGSIAAGVAFDSPTAVVGGVFSLLTSINDNLNGSNGPTIADVMNKLGEMDTKLDEINDKLDKNYNQLATETIRTQAMVDRVLLEEQEQAIMAFNTDYVVPLENYNRIFSDYIEQSYKSYVGHSEEIEIYVDKNSDGEWQLVPLVDASQSSGNKIQFTIPSFDFSKTSLEKNCNVITKGFVDRFNEDIDEAIKGVNLPSGLDAKTARDFVGANIIERFTKDYYTYNHDKALDLRNIAINYAKQINGKSTKSIVDRYTSRLEYMFNFAGEMKEYATGALANLDYTLDVSATLAAQACLYAGVNQEEIRSEYINARERICNTYKSIKSAKDGYCFLTHTNITGGFYRAYFSTKYSNLGNHPTFDASFQFESVNTGDVSGLYKKDDVYKHNYVDELDHVRIVTRMGLMKEIGLVSAENYIKYLVGANVLPAQAYRSYECLLSRKYLSNDALRFFTGLSIRNMNDSDRGIGMSCTATGNPNGDYFNIGWRGNFRGGHDAGCWSGRIAETTFIDALSGRVMDNKNVTAYATYSESHAYWFNDEYWAFVDNPVGNYFFTLEHKA